MIERRLQPPDARVDRVAVCGSDEEEGEGLRLAPHLEHDARAELDGQAVEWLVAVQLALLAAVLVQALPELDGFFGELVGEVDGRLVEGEELDDDLREAGSREACRSVGCGCVCAGGRAGLCACSTRLRTVKLAVSSSSVEVEPVQT